MSTVTAPRNSPAHIYKVGERVFVDASGGIPAQGGVIKRRVMVSGEPGYVVRLDDGTSDQPHVDLVSRTPNPYGVLCSSERPEDVGERIHYETESDREARALREAQEYLRARHINPWGNLNDGREVYWVKERTPTASEQLQKILGYPVLWEGFLSAEEKTRRGLERDGFIGIIDGKEVGLGRSVEEAVNNSNAHIIARNKAVFSGSLGEIVRSSPELLNKTIRQSNPAYHEVYGYRSQADLQQDIVRIARDFPINYDPPMTPAKGSFKVGNGTEVYTVTKDGIERYKGQYVLVEAFSVEASHIPTEFGLFGINPMYPEGVQERRYHKDPQEAAKVRNNAKSFLPGLVVNTNPDAVNGPPIVDQSMIVLGGNSRTMTQQLLYQQGKGDSIKNFLAASCSAGCFGFTPDDVYAMREPILVRQIDFSAEADRDKARYLVRVLNEVMTQDLDFASEITAIAGKLSVGQWREIAQFVANHKSEDHTLNSYLLTTGSSEFVQMLYRLGALTERNLSRLVFQDKNDKQKYGLLNRFGRRMVSELFLGYLLQKPQLIEQMNDQALTVFETIAPYLIVSACCDPVWDITDDVRIALRATNQAISSKDDLYRVMGQIDMFGGADSSYTEVQSTPRRGFLFHVVFAYRNSPAKMSQGFKRYAARASSTNEAAMTLGGIVSSSGSAESLQELVLAFGATEDVDSPTGYRLPNDPALRKQNPEQSISFSLPAKGGKTEAVTGIYDTDTGQFSPDKRSVYASQLKGQIMASSTDAGLAWRAMNLLTAAQGMTSESSWQQAARIIEIAIASGVMSEASFQEVRMLLFGEQSQPPPKQAPQTIDELMETVPRIPTDVYNDFQEETAVCPTPDVAEIRESLRNAMLGALPGLVAQFKASKATR